MIRIIILLTFIACICLDLSGQISTATLYSTEDTQTTSLIPANVNGGAGTTIQISATALNAIRSFIKFDLSSIPADAVIVSAKLRLTPSGTENVTTPSSSELYLDICNSDWSESTLSHGMGVSNNTIITTVTSSSWITSISKREFDVKAHIQALVELRVPNYGWRIRRNPEGSASGVTQYYSSEYTTTPTSQPELVIQYYRKATISAATIVHASTTSSLDGSISPIISNGSSTTRTYQWYDSGGNTIVGATSLNLTGKLYGWYGLQVTGTGDASDIMYYGFLVGVKCQDVAITYAPSTLYVDDAYLYNLVTGSGTTAIYSDQINSGNSVTINAEKSAVSTNYYNIKSLLKFRLWVDPYCLVNSANLTLTGNAHNPLDRTNESELDLVTSDWSESGVAYRTPFTTTTAGKINLAALPAGNSNVTVNITSFFNTWKLNNVNNYGMLFQLQSYAGTTKTKMAFNSSDASTASLKPKVDFNIHAIVSTCDYTSYNELVDKIDAGFATTKSNILKFFFTEEYTIDSGKKLPLKIYNEDNIAIAGIDFNGAAIGSLTLLPAINYVSDKNFVSLSLSGVTLTVGKFYTLELTNTLGEKKYLKFKYTN
ncbi:DNRLRE domain-containing protein [Fluviicola sp.]|uniref:DNRLRE domain-containing protein n=1 Tax=Fluviicola sp. TaxID=1917219 RepID=UPI003D291DD1